MAHHQVYHIRIIEILEGVERERGRKLIQRNNGPKPPNLKKEKKPSRPGSQRVPI